MDSDKVGRFYQHRALWCIKRVPCIELVIIISDYN